MIKHVRCWQRRPKEVPLHRVFCHLICTVPDALLKMKSIAPVKLCLLYEDSSIILVDKPPNVLSVPGKSAKPFTKFRHDQWEDAIRMAAEGQFDTPNSDCQRHLRQLVSTTSTPRKESRFYNHISKSIKVVDIALQQAMWKRISDADKLLNKQPFEEIPNHLVSTADLVERHCGHKVFIVHRLDMETSGVILYAKTEASASELCRQFRDREVT